MTRNASGQVGTATGAVSAAFNVSMASVAWSVVTSSIAVAIGIASDTTVLVALGAIGFVDAIGSVTLAVHFGRALRHDELSARFEHVAHMIVLVCLALVGASAFVVGVVRLVHGETSGGSVAGEVLAAASVIVLTLLATRKVKVAGIVGSDALRSDGHLSALGAGQAAVALLGTAATSLFGWSAADAVATALLGAVAVGLAGTTWLRRD